MPKLSGKNPKKRQPRKDETLVVREDTQLDFAAAQPPTNSRKRKASGASSAFSQLLFRRDDASIYLGDVQNLYPSWTPPTVIVSDGAYGLASFPGDPPTVAGLEDWYRPHIEAWTRHALPETTLWFWNSELGGATLHPLLNAADWEFRNCHVWDKDRTAITSEIEKLKRKVATGEISSSGKVDSVLLILSNLERLVE